MISDVVMNADMDDMDEKKELELKNFYTEHAVLYDRLHTLQHELREIGCTLLVFDVGEVLMYRPDLTIEQAKDVALSLDNRVCGDGDGEMICCAAEFLYPDDDGAEEAA